MTSNLYNPERVECVRWSPGSRSLKAAGTFLALLLAAGASQAQDLAPDDGNLAIHRALEVNYKTNPGQVFELQGSGDLQGWRDIGDVVFGEGGSVHDFVSSKNAPASFLYRVKISPSQQFGFAPSAIVGKQFAFNDDGGARVYNFDTRGSATEFSNLAGVSPATLAYSFRKNGDSYSRLTIERGSGDRDVYELDFSADHIGTYQRSEIRDGSTRDIDRGTFTLGAKRSPSQDPPATLIPQSLVGLSYLYSDGLTRERFDFVSNNSGRSIERAAVRHFGYAYQIGEETATATVVDGELTIEFEMTFTGESAGTYTRREYFDGTLEYTDEGLFSSGASVYHGAGANSTNLTLPADEIVGRSYLIRDGGTPCSLEFETQTSGKCVEGNQIDSFDFEYTVRCNATSVMKIKFSETSYDEYHMNYSDCTFMRYEVRSGKLVDTDTGTFSETP